MKTMFRFFLAVVVVVGLQTTANSAPRKILVEIVTSTTCVFCYPADVFYFQNWLPNYGGASSIVTLAYHVWWPSPGNDPMFLANPTPVQTRVTSYYGTTGAPNARIDGFIDGGAGYASWPGAIEGRFLDPSPVSITITGSRNGNTLNLNASIYADRAVNSSNWRVHWVVTQSGISEPQWDGNSYVPFIHDAVHRSMTPDGNGSPIAIVQGQTVDIPRTITLNSGWTAGDCQVVVFVQNNTDRKVQNVEVLDVSTLTGVGEPVNGVPTTFGIAQNYPNPFNPTTMLDYAVSQQSFVTIKVYNLLGEEVRTLVSQLQGIGTHHVEWDGTANDGKAVPTGVYLYEMTAGSFREMKKMVLLK